MDPIDLIICLIIALIIAGAVLAVVRELVRLEGWAWLRPYGGVIYALIVLLVVLVVIQFCFGGLPLHHRIGG